jgi:hypothetical protein
VWYQFAKLTPHDPSSVQRFGTSVSLSGNFALIGAINDGESASNSGAAYLFQEDIATGWHEVAKLKASDANENALFGNAVSLYDGLALIGANQESSTASRAGAAYIFAIPEPNSALLLCVACGTLAFTVVRRRGDRSVVYSAT